MDRLLESNMVLGLPLYVKDGSNLVSVDAYGHQCTVDGAGWTPPGRSFNGIDQRINCGDGVSLDITAEITLAAWVKITALTGNYQVIAGRDGAERNYWLVVSNIGELFAACNNGAAVENAISLANIVPLNEWVYAALRRGGGFTSGFINGVEVAAVPASGSINNGDASFIIGNRVAGDRPFKGLISEVCVYNRALSFLEIRQNYLRTKWRYQ